MNILKSVSGEIPDTGDVLWRLLTQSLYAFSAYFPRLSARTSG
jgi:hypothetical protein